MNREHLDRLLRRIAATEPEEISCSECFDLLAAGVEIGLAGAAEHPGWARLAQHLAQCAVCQDEYDVLRSFVAEDDDAGGPT
jgi:hypothetical protein